ncbi:MAG: InlB B-repeat-containing protein [Oscillospiraceae bacterium]|jgi:pilin isopeptide linkage protein/uncharacterized repeat protein (TIGR02543 family)|nr:InlB B-repeat-containing protein [Oscillospiraceae bacterium]
MGTYYVGSESAFSSAINSGDYPITIYVTGNFASDPSYLYSIYGEVSIQSNAATPYTISHLHIMAGEPSTLTLANITFSGDSTDDVVAIENYGALSLDGNTTISGYHNSAIFNGANGTVAMNGTLNGNTADYGGGIQNYSDVTIDSGVISNNMATRGGGIWNSSQNASVTMNGGSIQGNIATDSGGGIYNEVQGVVNLAGGDITANQATNNGGGIYSDEDATLAITGGTIQINSANNGGGIYAYSATIENATIADNTAFMDGGGIYTPYENLPDLSIDATTVFSGNIARFKTDILPEDIPMYQEHVNATNFTDGMPYGYNNYDIAYTRILATVEAQKAITGGTMQTFTFNLLDGEGNVIASAENDEGGVITFPGLYVDFDHSPYAYQVAEDQDMVDGFIPDPNAYPVSITVAPNADNVLTVTIDPQQDGIVLTNTYDPAAVDANFSAEKVAVNKPLEDSQFTFGLYDGDTPVSIGTNATDGTVTFQTITYAEPGDHVYTMREISTGGDGWTTDDTGYTVVVSITDDGSGTLVADVQYPDGSPPTFTNTYAAQSISVVLSGTKAAVGRALSGGEFSFGVYEGDALITSATNAADGTITFPAISYSAAGTHNYTIREITQSGNGWTTDSAEFPATVTITDDGEGNLSADVAYPGGTPGFTNTYALSPASVNLSATKLAFGKALTADAFTFGVYDNAGNLKASTMNAADGTINYPAIPFDAPGTYYYYLQEITPSGNGWTTDTRKDPVVITVTDNGAGALVANVLYPFGAASFRNQYGASPAIVVPTATKTASGAALPAGRFTFGLYNHDTGALVDTATNTGSGGITFKNLSFAAPGTYTYQVKEITPATGGWTTDKTVYTAVITVTDNGSGQLQSSIAFSPAAPSFHNSYDPSDTTEDIYGYKVLNNWDGEEVAFDFALTTPDGTVIDTAQSSEGVIHFTTSALTSPGTYNYIMKETSESGNGWTTDAATFPITVTVQDGGQGKLLTSVDYPDGTPTFINTYQTTPAALSLTGTKAAIGKALSGNDFIFGVYDENGDIQASAYNDANGNIAFPAITFDRAGTFTYTVRELSPDKEGWVTDKNTYPVTIEVIDNGDGTFSISTVRYVRGMPTFTNTYTCTPAIANLYAAKYATGKAMAGGEFDFAVEDAEGNPKAEAKNDAHGSVSFPAIVFDQPGIYAYTVLESTPPGHGWNTDTTLIPVTITVTDNGQGALDAAIGYPDGVPHFYNAYSENVVRFAANGGSATPNQNVPFGDPAQQPNDPTRDGYSFCGWFADAGLTIPYDFSQPVTAPITLYACWTDARETHTVAFDSQGGSPVASQSVKDGDAAQRPADPTRAGYTFGGWYSDAALTIPYDFSQPVMGDMTLYARWIAEEHTVIFDSNGGSAIPSQQVQDGQPIQRPADPARSGYSFCGWFADSGLTIPYDFSQAVHGDVTLYACWSRRAHAVPTARKVMQGAQLTAGQFAFRLTDENGAVVGTATNDAAGNIAFDSGAFALGTHVYTLEEVVQSAALYMLYDLRPRRITVTVSPSGDVTLAPMPTFVNRYVGWNVNGNGNRLWTGAQCDRCNE